MSDSIAGLATSIMADKASALRVSFQTAALRQQGDSERAIAGLIQESAETQRAALPAGQGKVVDILA
ncbi:hypothetical protein ASG40_05105 [Methylobacterium sp. Leaf399]|uniref:hypothetical protein n=1 Tax=Methylobacterium sp. Leaf399 TaxID=1736364 RepID=UPI0006F3F4AA|nr:hypothetical protein [Methylobacterium sp. Leaf399]KQT14694.1 hypothetical protein ASG40_05105 [Methylobacterium sp. Leaf399]